MAMAGDFPNLSQNITAHWPTPSIHPKRRAWFPAYGISLAVLSTVILYGRLWSHWRKRPGRLKVDEALACVSWLFAVLFTVISVTGTMRYGFDRHIWDASPALYKDAALIQWLSEGAFLFSTCSTKFSVLLFYHQLDSTAHTRTVRRIIYFFITFTGAYLLGSIFYLALLCRPLPDYWMLPNLFHPSPHSCASQHISYPLGGALSAFTTLYCVVIPYLVLGHLPMSRKERLGLHFLFLSGFAVFGAGVVRSIFLSRLPSSTNGDATWNGFNVFVVSQLECQLTLICASLPFLQRYIIRSSARSPSSTSSRRDSVLSRIGSSLSGKIRRPLPVRHRNVREIEISAPRAAPRIPEWEFRTLGPVTTPPRTRSTSPLDVHDYDRYLAGQYGPLPPPKDSKDLFDQYRKERHGGPGWV
ncbi:hypothetical protein GQ43DRAFT_60387 [Delitschia confertaspora ATCC 74209]|uniref:Rhodopsin domain-containing protein n=1 Tax=Delitschia confertaspora ATCC 74209 TaxID=1513339 RepID=A0A9P4JKF7_9PLEO|nr:hypothetical protein GQ43DRAFT_60387 [Delitschia confertaspora ATCC 74209]